jgi:hypothetical protein
MIKVINPIFLEKFTVGWLNSLVARGRRTPLQSEDLYEFNEQDKAKAISKHFETLFGKDNIVLVKRIQGVVAGNL